MRKIDRILIANGFNVENSNLIDSKIVDGKTILYVESCGIRYEIDGFNKKVINIDENVIDVITVTDTFKKPKGWHFRAVYVDIDGNVYYRGKEQPKLKGTLVVSID